MILKLDLPTAPYWSKSCPFSPDHLRSVLISSFNVYILCLSVMLLWCSQDKTQKALPASLASSGKTLYFCFGLQHCRALYGSLLKLGPVPTTLSSTYTLSCLLLFWPANSCLFQVLMYPLGCFLPKPHSSLCAPLLPTSPPFFFEPLTELRFPCQRSSFSLYFFSVYHTFHTGSVLLE